MSRAAIARIEAVNWNAADRWVCRAAVYAGKFNECNTRGFELTELQADELKTFAQSKRHSTGVFTTLEVCSRLWTSTVVGRRSYRNTHTLLNDTLVRGKWVGPPLIIMNYQRRFYPHSSTRKIYQCCNNCTLTPRRRTAQAIDLGIQPRVLYKMRDTGILDQLSRGVYRLSDLPPLSDPDLVTVATKISEGIICLISALAYHELTTQIPAEVSIALKANSRVPKLSYPPIKTYWYSKSTYSAGIEKHKIDNVDVRIYSPEKNDCGLLQVQKPNRYGHCARGALTLSRTKKAKAQDPNAIRADLSGGENNAFIPYLEVSL